MQRIQLFACLCLSLLLLAACHGRERSGRGGDGDDRSRSGIDGGGDPAPVAPGDVTLDVLGTDWEAATSDGRQPLRVQVRLANGTGAESASLAPELFHLRTAMGTEVLGTAGGFDGSCSADLAVGAGADRTCWLSFRPPVGEDPVAVTYRAADDREATADIPTCSASAPAGLCPAPGRCEAGTCASCTSFDESGCIACAFEALDTGECGVDGSCADAMDCALCPFSGLDSCICPDTVSCDGCEETAAEAYDCIARACPQCVAE